MDFREYYGISDQPEQKEDPTDINSSCFDAKYLFNHTSKTLSIHQLIDQERSLVADIMSLDNDMQTLVYDNYSKFLGASNVVRTFGNKIDTLTSQANSLQENLSSISDRSDTINESLKENRQKIQRLIGIQRLLERVDFISRLPEKLKTCLKTKNYKVAVDVWSKVERILRTQQHYPSFARIHKECTSIMEEIQSKVSEEMITTDVSVSNSILYGTLLFRMGVSLPLICSQLVHHRFLVVDNSIEELRDLPEEPFSALSHLNENVIAESNKFINLYKTKLVTLESEEENKKKELGILTNFTSNLFERLLPILPMDSLYTIDCKKLAAYLRLFVDMFTPISSDDIVQKQIHNMLKKYTNARINNIFTTCKEIIQSHDGKDIKDGFDAKFIYLLDQIINEYGILSMLDHKECTQILFQHISIMLTKCAKELPSFDSSKSLSIALITDYLANDGINHIFQSFTRIDVDVPVSAIIMEMNKQFSNATEECIKKYISYERAKFGEIIATGISEKIQTIKEEPTRESETAKSVVEEFNKLLDSLNEVFGNECRTNEIDSSSHITFRSPQVPSFVGIRDEDFNSIDRLFTSTNRLGLGKWPKLEKKGIFTSIVMYSLKTVLEVLRVQILSQTSFHQVQVDCYFIYTNMKDKVNGSDMFSTLIEEIINSASDRTLDPSPLELTEIRTLFSTNQ